MSVGRERTSERISGAWGWLLCPWSASASGGVLRGFSVNGSPGRIRFGTAHHCDFEWLRPLAAAADASTGDAS